MRFVAIAAGLSLAAASSAQYIESVYNRDTHDSFKLKDVKVESTVFGPIVRTSTLLVFENPYKDLTEASLNFSLKDDAALSGFAYYYGNEYVRGQLMDKAKAWFIYTAITSRNRDPGIMDQVTPTSYHCQIYPLKVGHDLRVKLYTIGFLQPKDNKLGLPKPEVHFDESVQPTYTIRLADEDRIEENPDFEMPTPDHPVTAVAQRFKDGRTYVAGMIRSGLTPLANRPPLKIIKAEYGVFDRPNQAADVTEVIANNVKDSTLRLHAYNQVFGIDPAPGYVKQVHIVYEQGGVRKTHTVQESQEILLGYERPVAKDPTFARLRDPKWVTLDQDTMAFMGWVPSNRKIAVRHNGIRQAFRPKLVHKGSEAAKLWAQQKLAQGEWRSKKDVLRFSLKYGVPSSYTALLAVPQEEMKLFKQKEKEFQKEQQRQARQGREWQRQREQNWRNGRGGDPEIRVTFDTAKTVDAILPDGRVIPLRLTNGVWGGNFDIPVAAPEGEYKVRVVATRPDGTTEEKVLTYEADRTAPEGQVTVKLINNVRTLEVRSEAKLAEVALYFADGTKLVLKEEEPGVYRAALPRNQSRGMLILKDSASNKREIPWFSQP